MPRFKNPITPASSTDISAREPVHMESYSELPPPALHSSKTQPLRSMPSSPPMTPQDRTMEGNQQRKRTSSGSAKVKSDSITNMDLPPPPSRARKIIHMKPKDNSTTSESKLNSSVKSQTNPPKHKQASSSSAASRKTARKTAHSIIERRRRSKMNEEFGVLKDMIPACKGVEMHKLAILQAGIEYVRYLQGCIDKLQEGHGDVDGMHMESVCSSQHSPFHDDELQVRDIRQASIATTPTASTNPSPALRPSASSADAAGPTLHTSIKHSASPPPFIAQTPVPSGISPAFQAIHFSPDLSRNSAFSSNYQSNLSGKPSPQIAPLPQAALPISNIRTDDAAEANATAALIMLTNDRRGASRGGMSVKDLLSG